MMETRRELSNRDMRLGAIGNMEAIGINAIISFPMKRGLSWENLSTICQGSDRRLA